MPPLPRGRCPECGGEAALRNGGLLRQHRPAGGLGARIGLGEWCPGSGEKAADWQIKPRHGKTASLLERDLEKFYLTVDPDPPMPMVDPVEPADPDWQHDERED